MSNMIDLHFKGPFHISEVQSIKEDESKRPNKYGIYIFGFTYQKENGSIGEPNTYENNETISWKEEREYFIPYYVGKDSNLNGFARILEHHDLYGSTGKLTRFSNGYMKSFFKGAEGFPIHYNHLDVQYRVNVRSWANKRNNGNKLAYFNHKDVMDKIYPNTNLRTLYPSLKTEKNPFEKNQPCYLVQKFDGKLNSWCHIDDPIGNLILNKNNFWFAYASFEETNLSIPDFSNNNKNASTLSISKSLEILETITFWSLKGLTISSIRKNIEVKKLENIVRLSWDKRLKGVFNENARKSNWATLDCWNDPVKDHAKLDYFKGY